MVALSTLTTRAYTVRTGEAAPHHCRGGARRWRMTISIAAVVPTHRRALLLERALRSIATQLRLPDEVLVVSDREDDVERTRAVVQRSSVPSAQHVLNDRARGPSGARNAGARRATAEWLAFLDDDDEWVPAYLAEATALATDSGLDVICTDLVNHYEDGVERPGKQAPLRLHCDDFLTRNPGLIGSNLIVRRSLYWDIGGFDESILAAEDMDFGIRLSLHAGVRYAPLRQMLVRHHQHSADRLCTPQGDFIRAGVARFYALHSARMTEAQRAEFRQRMQRLWQITEHGELIE